MLLFKQNKKHPEKKLYRLHLDNLHLELVAETI